jgi:hypothetical protein
MKKTIDSQALYLDWVNNYLTREKMAEDYGLSMEKLETLLQLGKLNNSRKARTLTPTERLEYEALMVTMPSK